jgi:hypothetical protein
MKQISKDWWIGLDDSYRTRADNGSLVLWKAERTIWVNVWNDHEGWTDRERLNRWIADRSPEATDLFEQQDGGLLRFGYLLEEPEEGGGHRLGLYSYTVRGSSTVQMACYFDLKEDLPWATAVSKSLSFGRPDTSRNVDEPVGKFGHLVLASEKVIGPDGEPVLFAYREPGANEQDSGWRFFHGDEDEPYTSDPRNITLCPLSSFLEFDPTLRVIINSPAGTAWERWTPSGPWQPADGSPADEGEPDWR